MPPHHLQHEGPLVAVDGTARKASALSLSELGSMASRRATREPQGLSLAAHSPALPWEGLGAGVTESLHQQPPLPGVP